MTTLTSHPAARDVAHYILTRTGPVSVQRLHTLLYYAQAWSLVWDERPLFPEDTQARRGGPIIAEVYDLHGSVPLLTCSHVPGDGTLLDETARETVDAVLSYYQPLAAPYLSDLVHLEDPWNQARQGDAERPVITHASMAEYYLGLPPDAANG